MSPWEVVWIDAPRHRAAEVLLFAWRRRGMTIVDAAGVVVMRELALRTAFAFDDGFAREGFEVLAP